VTGVVVSGLTKSFSRLNVLDELALTVTEGSVSAILGPSGSGKTTLLRLLAGFEHADAGSIAIGNQVVDDGGERSFVPPRQRRVGFVPQEGALFPHLTVARNIGFGVRRGTDRAERIAELIEIVGLHGLGERYPHQLSGGQQQRVAVARALAVRPSLMLLDEPFSSLDAGLRTAVRADVKRILEGTGSTTVLVTHDQDEALSWADEVAVIRDGRITQYSTPRDIYARPVDAGTARFVGVANLIDGTSRGSVVDTAFGSLPLMPGTPRLSGATPVIVLVRPEQIQVSIRDSALRPRGIPPPNDATGLEGPDGLPGRIADVQFYGHDVVVTVVPERPCGADAIVARTADRLAAPTGTPVTLSVSEPVHVWRK
jgi:iron(III) transport system ATP-binding protein